jgi:hypothetical protein
MGRKSSIHRLAPETRAYIEAALARDAQTLDELIADLRERFPQEALPSRSAVGRYGKKLERRLIAVRASTDAMRQIREHAGDKMDARSEALTTLVQTELFEAILMLQEADDPDADAGERLAMLSAAAKNIATLTRSSVNLKRFQAEAEEAGRKKLLEEQRVKLDALGKSGEVAPEVLAKIIKVAYDL